MSRLSLSGDGAERISDLDYMEAQQEDGKFIEWSFHDALGNGRWYGKREHDGLWNDDLRFARTGRSSSRTRTCPVSPPSSISRGVAAADGV